LQHMSASPEKIGSSYQEQLSALEQRLGSQGGEVVLGEIGLAIRTLLADNGASEARIRQILERQFDKGNLRRESYELVEKLLGKIVAEQQASAASAPAAEDPYVQTAVLDQPGDEAAPAATVSKDLQVGSVLRDRFLLKQVVAEGGMGTVFKALDRRMAETGEKHPFVAIKVLNSKLSRNSTALRALQQEAAKGRCLQHPNIVRFIDLDREEDVFFIVMEWLNGRSLARILDDNRGNAIDFDMAMDIVRQTSRALTYAHQRGVVHADVKPGNIMITPDGQVKLIDFGVARIRQKENEGKSRFDPSLMRAGSPAYSSMQVLTGEDPVPADDVFSLACLMYRLIAGYRVFGPRNAADAAEEGMEPQKPEGLSAEQWQVLKKALSYSRVTRFASPKAFVDAFGAAGPAPRKASPPRTKVEQAPSPRSMSDQPLPRVRPPAARMLAHDETTEVALESPMRAEREPIMYEPEPGRRGSPLRVLVVGIILVAAAAVVLRPDIIERFNLEAPLASLTALIGQPEGQESAATARGGDAESVPPAAITEPAVMPQSGEVIDELVIDTEGGTVAAAASPADETLVDDEFLAATPDEMAATREEETQAMNTPATPPVELIDFSRLPVPDLLLSLRTPGDDSMPTGALTMREDGGDGIIDLVRTGDLSQSFAVQFVESESTGNQSSWESGRYHVENDGMLVFDAGQPRARIHVSMRSNPVREPDRDVTLSVHGVSDPTVELATIRLTLEDDDQRRFEAGLPRNTIGFAVNQVSVRESDSAVQIDVIRYRPDNTAVEVPFTLTDVTATEGQDYFAPGIPVIYFAAGQRTARVLVPLGQDARPESDEAFMLELDTPAAPANSNIFKQVAVMIRDDDS